jgi:hypothetical protein
VHAGVVAPGLQSVAVMFYFVNPAGTRRCLIGKGGQTGLDKRRLDRIEAAAERTLDSGYAPNGESPERVTKEVCGARFSRRSLHRHQGIFPAGRVPSFQRFV